MASSHDSNRRQISRREILCTAGAASIASLASRAAYAEPSLEPQTPTGRSPDAHRLTGIDPHDVFDEYHRRDIESISDAELYRQSAAIISSPPKRGGTSFTLHAPLELMARYGLLPFVEPAERTLARLQMVASASAYDDGVTAREPPEKIDPFPSLSVAKKEFTQSFQQGRGAEIEAFVLQIAAQFGTASLVHLLTPLALPTLTGASHSHIGLWLLLRHGRASETGDAALLRAAVRSLAQDPKLQLSSFSGMDISGTKALNKTPGEIEQEILAKLVNPTQKAKRSGVSLRSLLQAGESTGNADTFFGDFVRHNLTNEQMDAGFRAVLRICAHSMLQDDVDQAKFGWSHCLTLPQAACGLSSLNMDRKLALASALVWITAYRSALSRRALDFAWAPKKNDESLSVLEALHTSPTVAAARVWHADRTELPLVRRTLATQASIRNDQHLAKYTRACFDMGSFDPMYKQLYLAAAAHLCGLWIQERPREKIVDNLLERRNTSG